MPQPGDFGLTSFGTWASWWIVLGQALLGDPSRFTHAFVVVDDNCVVEAWSSGARLEPLSRYDNLPTAYSNLPLTAAQRNAIVAAAHGYVGTGYSFLDYLALALDHWHIRPKWLKAYIADSGHMICSQLVDQCYQDAGVQLFDDGRDASDVTPGDLTYVLVNIGGAA